MGKRRRGQIFQRENRHQCSLDLVGDVQNEWDQNRQPIRTRGPAHHRRLAFLAYGLKDLGEKGLVLKFPEHIVRCCIGQLPCQQGFELLLQWNGLDLLQRGWSSIDERSVGVYEVHGSDKGVFGCEGTDRVPGACTAEMAHAQRRFLGRQHHISVGR